MHIFYRFEFSPKSLFSVCTTEIMSAIHFLEGRGRGLNTLPPSECFVDRHQVLLHDCSKVQKGL